MATHQTTPVPSRSASAAALPANTHSAVDRDADTELFAAKAELDRAWASIPENSAACRAIHDRFINMPARTAEGMLLKLEHYGEDADYWPQVVAVKDDLRRLIAERSPPRSTT